MTAPNKPAVRPHAVNAPVSAAPPTAEAALEPRSALLPVQPSATQALDHSQSGGGPEPVQPHMSAQMPMQVNVQVSAPAAPQLVIQVKQRGLFVRALYYIFVGWWLSGLLMFAAGVCIASVVLLPVGLALVNRLPQVMTLRPHSTAVSAQLLADGSMQYTVGSEAQRSMVVRTVYFCLVGWWAGMLVMAAAWLLSVLILTMPLGLMLLNRVPAAVTLRRN
jgi:uncharacterized membrane protein YccF (DUF307 family)